MFFPLRKGIPADLFVRVLVYAIITSNIIILSKVFLYPRLHYMLSYWGVTEREILLSSGPRDNPNMEHLRAIYRLMYFIKDNTEEGSTVYFIDPHFSRAEAYKILLPRRVKFIESSEINGFLKRVPGLSSENSYIVFKKEDLPEEVQERQIVWCEEGWGICRLW